MSNIQFNLLPDVKLTYVKAQRTRRMITTVALIVSAVAIAILLIMIFTVDVVQKKQLNNAASAVTTANHELSLMPDLNKILTVQNQLTTLVGLHQSKHISSRLFTYLPEVTPVNVTISSVIVDLTQNTITINGSAADQLAVNTFIDTLKFAQYEATPQSAAQSAFSSVVEGSFTASNQGSSYSVTAQFDPALFANSGSTPKITVSNQVTTRSVVDDPSNPLFTSGSSNSGTGSQ